MKNPHMGKKLLNLWLDEKELKNLKDRINWVREGLVANKITNEEYNLEIRKIGEIIYNALENDTNQ